MTWRRWVDPRRWPSLVLAGVTLLIVILVSGAIASFGVRFMGSQAAFEAARQQALPWLFLWRWACYGGLAYGWLRHWKPGVLAQLAKDDDRGAAARERLVRLERLAVGVAMFIEGYNLLDWLGGV